jgi:predicted acylesterase/phospholipase RssA
MFVWRKGQMDWVKTLVLGGGGVKSIAYLGAMEEMVRMGTEWKSFVNGIERVAGASAGAFSAVCIAAKKSLDEL